MLADAGACLATGLVLALVVPARAAAPGEAAGDRPGDAMVELDWDAPPGCPDGARVLTEDRVFWIRAGDSGYTTVATRTRADEPPGVVRVQYPDEAGWSNDTMLAFLGSVHVGPGALPGQG
jgi:hypothetical protein